MPNFIDEKLVFGLENDTESAIKTLEKINNQFDELQPTIKACINILLNFALSIYVILNHVWHRRLFLAGSNICPSGLLMDVLRWTIVVQMTRVFLKIELPVLDFSHSALNDHLHKWSPTDVKR